MAVEKIKKPPRLPIRSGFHKPTRKEEDRSKQHPRQEKHKKDPLTE